MAEHYFCKTTFEPGELIERDGVPILERHAELRGFLRERLGPEAAALFAEPLISRGNDKAQATIAWYVDNFEPGSGQPLSALSLAGRNAAERWLADHLRPVQLLASTDPDPRARLLAEALILRDASDIRMSGDRPVLVNWAMAPAAIAADPDARRRHAADLLGAFVPRAPLADPAGSIRAMPAAASALRGGATAPAAASAHAPAGQTAQTAYALLPAAAPRSVVTWLAWVPLVVLLAIAAGLLIWLLLPGTRILPAPAQLAQRIDEADALGARANAALRAHRDRLRAALSEAVCRDDGLLILPDGRTPEGLLIPPGPDGARAAPEAHPIEGSPQPLLAPAPARVVIPGEDPDTLADAPRLLAVAEGSTVFILVSAQGGVGTGTGVVVAPGLILTNHHVVDLGPGATIRVLHAALPSAQTAELVASRGPLEATGGDFALLRIADQTLPALPFHVSAAGLRLRGVIATGYPGDVLSGDPGFQAALASGRLPAPPGMTVTDGIVNAEQRLQSGAQVLVHSAPLSSGNSGGPLIDLCGRVVGINTFVHRGPLRTLNFALSAEDALAFLASAGIAAASRAGGCTPRILPPHAATPAAPGAAPPAADLPSDAPPAH